MKSIDELTATDEPAIELVREWVSKANSPVELLPPSKDREAVLLEVQVTTRSTMGAITYETGGVLIDNGWLRLLGSGNPRLNRTLAGWNRDREAGVYLIADDAVGGFFALNGGAFADGDRGDVYYWSPDDLDWEPLGVGYTDFFIWSLSDRLAEFYRDLRWPGWQEDVSVLSGGDCYGFFPFLWTVEGSISGSKRGVIPTEEAFTLKLDLVEQMRG